MAAHGYFELSVNVYIRLTHIRMQHTYLNSRYTDSNPSPLEVIGNTYKGSSTTMYCERVVVIKTRRGEGMKNFRHFLRGYEKYLLYFHGV